MKKYIKPELKVTYVALSNIVAASPEVTLSKTDSAVDPDSFDSREDNAWDIWGSESAEGCE